jgi:hypothetical protein
MTVLVVAGTVLQSAGLVMTAFGLHRTWRDFRPEGETLLGTPVKRWVTANWARVDRWGRRLLRNKRSVRIQPPSADSMGGGVSARLRIGFGTLPDTLTTAEALAELDKRTRRLLDRVNEVGDALGDAEGKLRARVEAVEGRVAEVRDELKQQDRRIAVGGARLEAVGLILVAAGLVLTTVGGLLDASP